MKEPSTLLPRFRHPPVVEVALAVQFGGLTKLNAAEMGLFWTKFRDRFPNVEQHPPISYRIERKGVRRSAERAELVVSTGQQPMLRLWMINEASNELLQLQPDRFVRNWRRYHDKALPYPHYDDYIRPAFKKDFKAFEDFVEHESLGPLTVDQCEITYVNHVMPLRVWKTHADLHRVFRGWSARYAKDVGSRPDSIGIRLQHDIAHEEEFVGRLYVQIDSAFIAPTSNGRAKEPDGEQATAPVPAFVMQLIARGRPLGKGINGILRFLDLGRSRIVSTFTNMTTERMHKAWGRSQ